MTTIYGRITNQHGNAIPEATILIEKASSMHPDIAQLSNDDGSYKLHDIKAGAITLLFNATNYSTKPISLFLEKDEKRRLDVVLDLA